MNRNLIVSSILGIMLILAALALAQPEGPVAAREPAGMRQNWEYGLLLRPGSAGGWRAPGVNVSAAKAYDLYREMGGNEPEQNFDNGDLLTLLGREGWELVSVVPDDRGQTFYLKRQRR